jgi:hypothetical protein
VDPLFNRRDTDYCHIFAVASHDWVSRSLGLLAIPVACWDSALAAGGVRHTWWHYHSPVHRSLCWTHVRYTSAKPANIAARQNIRHRGLVLLENLHSSSEYERIIVVGHSLGSILAYDLISYFWAARLDSRTVVEDSAEFQALQNLEKTVAELEKAPVGPERTAATANFLTAQRVFGEALRARPKPKANEPDRRWLITDLITLGSPLSYANFLIAKTEEDLRRRQKEREDPTSPPIREQLVGDAIGKARNAKFKLDENKPQLLCFPFWREEAVAIAPRSTLRRSALDQHLRSSLRCVLR